MLFRLARLSAAALWATAASTVAAPIVQDHQTGNVQLLSYPPIGQSFVAEDATVSVGFWLHELRPDIAPNGASVTMTLYEGAGIHGALLGSVAVGGLSSGFVGWVDADFAHVTLAVGSVYTAIVTDTTPRWAVDFSSANPYAGGSLVFSGVSPATHDARFRVLPIDPPAGEPPVVVSEPAALALFGFAMAGLAALRRRAA
ncbi:PEP-CTERM sorting domain-containing protein [Elioraea tepidiphila]|jgi:hypothetical protein|uniref:PEP-CTERM sorting domain-containing protein n=1 Tax=Elioraea tepidiphila TaxID=457934 RepID=UPI00036BE382|nr:PEP-CTERM sorting domain-containing protein [Elioraea tepidiphila]